MKSSYFSLLFFISFFFLFFFTFFSFGLLSFTSSCSPSELYLAFPSFFFPLFQVDPKSSLIASLSPSFSTPSSPSTSAPTSFFHSTSWTTFCYFLRPTSLFYFLLYLSSLTYFNDTLFPRERDFFSPIRPGKCSTFIP